MCRRCEAPLAADESVVPPARHQSEGGRSFGRWVLWILGVVFTILATAYASLLLTSDAVTTHERQIGAVDLQVSQ